MEPFVVRHYTGEDRPTIKGNGFDGLQVGEDRDEAERFVAFVNAIREQALEEAAQAVDKMAKSAVRYEERDVFEVAAEAIRALKRQ
ncbi:hypothetical protein SAMN05192564_1152 [Paraburkholderia sartisoli]|uniref:Uncharacterized protein n=2 Tax=Paraburkholderia sartisoli TaxID=83784 RepID=A0A1H4HUH5_9BURK|nr:hypothetical protein SAMN05192564_1152 [Paraburkholderia sartisoli]